MDDSENMSYVRPNISEYPTEFKDMIETTDGRLAILTKSSIKKGKKFWSQSGVIYCDNTLEQLSDLSLDSYNPYKISELRRKILRDHKIITDIENPSLNQSTNQLVGLGSQSIPNIEIQFEEFLKKITNDLDELNTGNDNPLIKIVFSSEDIESNIALTSYTHPQTFTDGDNSNLTLKVNKQGGSKVTKYLYDYIYPHLNQFESFRKRLYRDQKASISAFCRMRINVGSSKAEEMLSILNEKVHELSDEFLVSSVPGDRKEYNVDVPFEDVSCRLWLHKYKTRH